MTQLDGAGNLDMHRRRTTTAIEHEQRSRRYQFAVRSQSRSTFHIPHKALLLSPCSCFEMMDNDDDDDDDDPNDDDVTMTMKMLASTRTTYSTVTLAPDD